MLVRNSVFILDIFFKTISLGKTSTIKAIEGGKIQLFIYFLFNHFYLEPTDNVQPTISSSTISVSNPLTNKNNDQQRVRIIDVSGERRFRQKSWSQYYDQIHGLIFVIDASDKRRLDENQEALENLIQNDKLKNKPILM